MRCFISGGGSQVRWRSNGQELIYVAPNGGAIQLGDARHQYTLSADGQRILIATVTAPPPAPISLILNWKSGR